MHSEYYYNVIGGWFAIGSIMGSFPFRWLYTERKIQASKRSEWINEFVIFMFFIPNYILQTIKVIWFQVTGDLTSLTILYIVWIFSTGILILALVQLYKLSEIRKLLTMVNDYYQGFNVLFIRDYDQRTLSKMRSFDVIATGLIACIILGVFVGTLHHAIFPGDPTYVGSLIAEEDLQIPLVYWTLTTGYFCGLVFMLTLIGLQVVVMADLIYVLAIVLLPEFQTDRLASRYEATTSLRTFQELPLQYRCLQLLHTFYLEIGAFVIIPLQMLGTNHILFCNFMLISKWDTLKEFNKLVILMFSLIAIAVMGGMLDCAGKLCAIGEKTLTSWKYHNWGSKWNNKYMGKFRKSCKPIRVHYGNSYTIRKVTVLKFFRGIVRGTFRSLLALKK